MKLFRRSKGKGKEVPAMMTQSRSAAADDTQPEDEGSGTRATTRPGQEIVGLFPVEETPASQEFNIDIVAVHGLGGGYQATWTVGDRNWLRDFLPVQLRAEGINPRVMCYGYDSSTAFSKSVLGIHNVAEDLLDRLRSERRQENEKSRPIILIAHSLGGLIVKKTLNTAWNDPATYGSLLEKVFGLVFFGVPHRGADLAYWAGFPASLLDHALLGFGGNRSFLKALQKNSDEWRTISRDFVQRGAQLSSIRTFFETEKLGNIWVVDEDSARLLLPNERCTGVATSNHITMCKFDGMDSQKYGPVWGAILEMAEKATADENRPPEEILMISADTPFKVPKFYGREAELEQMINYLKPGVPGRTLMILWGLGSFGKTQLARQYQSLHNTYYTSQIWIRTSTFKAIEQGTPVDEVVLSLNEFKFTSTNSRKRQRVLLPPSNIRFQHVKARLEQKTNPDWLLVIDGLENMPVHLQINALLPQCNHGTIIFTTAQNPITLASILEGKDINIGGIDCGVGARMFLDRCREEYPESTVTDIMCDVSKEIVEALDGSPLAIEQASALLSSKGPLSVNAQKKYLSEIKEQYASVMAYQPEINYSYYDKDNRSIIGAFNSLEKEMSGRNKDAINLLTLCSFFDPGKIDVRILLRFKGRRLESMPWGHLFNQRTPQTALCLSIFVWLAAFFDAEPSGEEGFTQAVIVLRRYCCLRGHIFNNSITNFIIEGAIRTWCRGRLSREELEVWAIMAAYVIGGCCQTIEDPKVLILEHRILPHVRSSDGFLLSSNLQSKRLQGPDDPLSWIELHVAECFARFYYQRHALPDALRAIKRAGDLQLLVKTNGWLKDGTSLNSYYLMAMILRDCGELTEAGEVFVNLLSACKDILQSDDPFLMEVARQATALWNQRAHDEELRRRVSASGDIKKAVWLPARSPEIQNELPGYEDLVPDFPDVPRGLLNAVSSDQYQFTSFRRGLSPVLESSATSMVSLEDYTARQNAGLGKVLPGPSAIDYDEAVGHNVLADYFARLAESEDMISTGSEEGNQNEPRAGSMPSSSIAIETSMKVRRRQSF